MKLVYSNTEELSSEIEGWFSNDEGLYEIGRGLVRRFMRHVDPEDEPDEDDVDKARNHAQSALKEYAKEVWPDVPEHMMEDVDWVAVMEVLE